MVVVVVLLPLPATALTVTLPMDMRYIVHVVRCMSRIPHCAWARCIRLAGSGSLSM